MSSAAGTGQALLEPENFGRDCDVGSEKQRRETCLRVA